MRYSHLHDLLRRQLLRVKHLNKSHVDRPDDHAETTRLYWLQGKGRGRLPYMGRELFPPVGEGGGWAVPYLGEKPFSNLPRPLDLRARVGHHRVKRSGSYSGRPTVEHER